MYMAIVINNTVIILKRNEELGCVVTPHGANIYTRQTVCKARIPKLVPPLPCTHCSPAHANVCLIRMHRLILGLSTLTTLEVTNDESRTCSLLSPTHCR